MKKIITLILTLAAIATGMAQEQTMVDIDTVKVINNPSRVTITRNGTATTISATTSDKVSEQTYNYTTDVISNDKTNEEFDDDITFNLSLPFLKDSNKDKRVCISFFKDIYIGALVPLSHPYGFKTGWEIGYGKLVSLDSRLNKHGLSFNIGLGIFDKRFRIKDYTQLNSDYGVISVTHVDDNIKSPKSNFHLFGFQMPVLLKQQIKDWTFAAGGVVNLNTYLKGSRSYTIDNIKSTETYKGLHQKPVTIDLKAAISYDGLGVYCRYSPMSVFRDGYGPKFKTINFGITIDL